VVASKIDTEGALLGSLIAACLRAHGLPVQTRLQLGPTSICRAALLAGAVDIYPEYTGNGATFFHRAGDPAWHEAAAAWRLVRALDAPNGVVWLPAAPADNGWGIAIRQDELAAFSPHASPQNPPSLADFARYVAAGGRMKLAASVEFVESPDALPAFERSYGFHLRQDQLLTLAGGNTAATLRATAERLSGIDAGMAYSTDGALDALHLVLLTDPHHAQIVFQPAPVARAAVLQAYPAIPALLEPVFAALTLPVLRGLNARIAAQGVDPARVAADFLASRT
jgi:osmoprotectant transport system substrate-binding protein